MRFDNRVMAVAALVGMLTAGALGQATAPSSKPASGPADEVAVLVNGRPIMESEVNAILGQMIGRGREASREDIAKARQQLKPRVSQLVESLIDDQLVNQAAEQAGMAVSEKELDDAMEQSLQVYLKASNLSREEYSRKLKEQTGRTVEDFLKEQARSDRFKAYILRERLIEKKYADDLKVTDEDVREYYEQNVDKRYARPEQVRASHILFGISDPKTRQPMSEEARKEQRKKAEEVLAEVKKPGADFAALAKQHSTCPSKDRGGDLDFFARERMVAPFSEAAFSMKVGDISDIVETKFGYHIIKVTDRRPASTMPFDEVKDQIRKERETTKKRDVVTRYRQELRKDAKIVYPPGKEPATRPAPRPAATRPSATRPAGTRPAGRIRVVPPAQSKPQP